jgi:hypothetical protein
MKICPVGVELFHVVRPDGRTDRDMTDHIVAFRNFVQRVNIFACFSIYGLQVRVEIL